MINLNNLRITISLLNYRDNRYLNKNFYSNNNHNTKNHLLFVQTQQINWIIKINTKYFLNNQFNIHKYLKYLKDRHQEGKFKILLRDRKINLTTD